MRTIRLTVVLTPVRGPPGAGHYGTGKKGRERLTRRFDGQPETDRDTRFFDLRESGWGGPIDQDGNAVMSRTDNAGNPLATTSIDPYFFGAASVPEPSAIVLGMISIGAGLAWSIACRVRRRPLSAAD